MIPAVQGAYDSRTPIQSETDLFLLILDWQTCFDKGSTTDDEKSRILGALNFNFESLKQNPSAMTLALYTYGRLIYGQNYKLAAITLRLSLEGQIEKGTRYEFYNSFSDMEREPFDFHKIFILLEKVDKVNMQLIHTLKWYAFACMNSIEVGNPLYLSLFEKLYAKIKTFCASLNTKDAQWEIGQVIYNSRPLCVWKNPGNVEAELAWIKDAEYSLEIEGNTLRARTFQAQLLSMESKLLDRLPNNDERFNKKLALARRAYKISQENPDFDPFLKLKFVNDLASILHQGYLNKKDGINKEEIVNLFKQLVQEVNSAKNPHEYYAIYLENAAYFETTQANHNEFIILMIRAAEIAASCNKGTEAARYYRSAAMVARDQGNQRFAKELYERASLTERAP